MARKRDPESSRDRLPPPPRMTGVGMSQMALFAGFIAVLMAFFGIYMASSATDANVQKRVDALGSAICAALTAPEYDTWGAKHGTYAEQKARLKKVYTDLVWTHIEKKHRNRMGELDHNRNRRNLTRLRDAAQTLSIDTGTLRGLQIVFDVHDIRPHSVGARINPKDFTFFKTLLGDIEVGYVMATAASGDTQFSALVYHRAYKKAGGKSGDWGRGPKIGDVYVILSRSEVEAKQGPGMWLLLTPLLVGIAIVLIIMHANRASSGIKSLARDLDMIGRGKLDHRVHTGGSGEVGYAQRMADRMAKNLQLIQSTGSTDLDEAVEKEMDLAHEIHASLRPSAPPRVPGFEVETLFRGGSEIGGDYFDYIELDENRVALVIADCSDSLRGVPAAMVMAMTRAYIKAAVDPDSGPAEWLKWVNRRLARDLKSGMAVTALVSVVDSSKGEVIAASAGHRPIVMWRKGKTALINPNGIALGLDVGPVFDKTIEEKRFSMHKNDRIVMYTDGVISAENDAGEPYGEERFLESIRRQGAMNSSAFVNFVAGGIERHLEGREQRDDITISTLKKMK